MDVQVEIQDEFNNEKYYSVILIYKTENSCFKFDFNPVTKNKLLDKWKKVLSKLKNITADTSEVILFKNELTLAITGEKSKFTFYNDAHSMTFEINNDEFIKCVNKIITWFD